jgi:DNA-binding HxlR family transcriptional regulator
MDSEEIPESVCEVARALAVIGDRWTLLIMREVGLGIHKFEEIQAQTGMSSHLLSTRLKRMEEAGLLEKRRYSQKPARYEYHPTVKGRELDSVKLVLRAWVMRWGSYAPGTGPSFAMTYKSTGEPIDELWQPPRTERPFTYEDVHSEISETFQAERAARLLAFQESKVKRRIRKS